MPCLSSLSSAPLWLSPLLLGLQLRPLDMVTVSALSLSFSPTTPGQDDLWGPPSLMSYNFVSLLPTWSLSLHCHPLRPFHPLPCRSFLHAAFHPFNSMSPPFFLSLQPTFCSLCPSWLAIPLFHLNDHNAEFNHVYSPLFCIETTDF